MFEKNVFLSKLITSCLTIALFAGSILMIYTGRFALMSALLGIGIATLLTPTLTYLNSNFKIPRLLSVITLLILTALVPILTFWGLGSVVSVQLEELATQSPQIIQNLEAKLSALYARYPVIQQQANDIDIGATLKAGGLHFVNGAQSSFTLLTGVAFAFIVAIYTSISSQLYVSLFLGLLPASKRSRVSTVLSRLAHTLRVWFRAQLIDMAIIGVLTMLGLWIVGANYWAILGLLTAVLGIIPYLGILIMIVVSTCVTIASDPTMLPWVLGVFLVTQQIEGNIVMPLVMKGQMDIPEVPLLVFMLLMGGWFGLLGVFLSTPLFALLKVMHQEFLQPYLDAS